MPILPVFNISCLHSSEVRRAGPPSIGWAWDSAGWTGTALGRPMRPLRVCGGRRCVYHLEPPRASTSRCGHRPCRTSHHPAIPLTCASLRRAAYLFWRYRPGAARPSVVRTKAAACTAGCAAARAARAAAADAERGAAGVFFVFFGRTVSHTPCLRLLCQQRPWRRWRRRQRAQHRLDARSRRSRERCEWQWRRRRRAMCAAARFNTAGGA